MKLYCYLLCWLIKRYSNSNSIRQGGCGVGYHGGIHPDNISHMGNDIDHPDNMAGGCMLSMWMCDVVRMDVCMLSVWMCGISQGGCGVCYQGGYMLSV